MGEYGYFCARGSKGDGVCYVQEYSLYFFVAKEPCVGFKDYGLKFYAGQLHGVQVLGCFFCVDPRRADDLKGHVGSYADVQGSQCANGSGCGKAYGRFGRWNVGRWLDPVASDVRPARVALVAFQGYDCEGTGEEVFAVEISGEFACCESIRAGYWI